MHLCSYSSGGTTKFLTWTWTWTLNRLVLGFWGWLMGPHCGLSLRGCLYRPAPLWYLIPEYCSISHLKLSKMQQAVRGLMNRHAIQVNILSLYKRSITRTNKENWPYCYAVIIFWYHRRHYLSSPCATTQDQPFTHTNTQIYWIWITSLYNKNYSSQQPKNYLVLWRTKIMEWQMVRAKMGDQGWS